MLCFDTQTHLSFRAKRRISATQDVDASEILRHFVPLNDNKSLSLPPRNKKTKIMENNQPQLNEHNKTEHPPMHTCEHVVNRTMVNLFGCGRAVSAHIERKKSKLDFALAECPTDAQIAEIEKVVNETLRKNLPVTMEFISQEEAMGRFDMKRLPEGASDTVRVVHVGDYDECLCIGLHVENTSEVGTFKIISHDYKEGIFRMRFKIIPLA